MNLTGNTILITGGSSGIGLELAKQFLERQNTVIICARSAERLAHAKREMPELHTFRCDITQQSDRTELWEYIERNHPDCNVLINNAAVANKTDFLSDPGMPAMIESEVHTNFLAPVFLTRTFLNKNARTTVINITTGLIYAPRAVYPIYNATKSALHAFTQVLRKQVESRGATIIEVMMPVVDTPWHKGKPPRLAIPAVKAVKLMLHELKKDRTEIRIGRVKLLYVLSRIAPRFAFNRINSIRD